MEASSDPICDTATLPRKHVLKVQNTQNKAKEQYSINFRGETQGNYTKTPGSFTITFSRSLTPTTALGSKT